MALLSVSHCSSDSKRGRAEAWPNTTQSKNVLILKIVWHTLQKNHSEIILLNYKLKTYTHVPDCHSNNKQNTFESKLRHNAAPFTKIHQMSLINNE